MLSCLLVCVDHRLPYIVLEHIQGRFQVSDACLQFIHGSHGRREIGDLVSSGLINEGDERGFLIRGLTWWKPT